MKKAFLAFILTMAVAGQAFSDEIDEARELIMAEVGEDILYLSRINLGIPGGDNWIANRGDWVTSFHTVNVNKEVKRAGGTTTVDLSMIQYFDTNSQSYINLEYDIMQDIPGTRIGSRMAKFGDYNGDGIDEIFLINTAIELSCIILGYDSNKGRMVNYFNCVFNLVGTGEPSPVFFANYLGRDGILVHMENGDTGRYVWAFYVWYEESRKYAQLTFIWDDDIDYSAFPVVRKKGESQNNSEPKSGSVIAIVEIELPDSEEDFADDSGKNSRFIFYIAIAVGVIALVLALFFVVRRKKG